MRHILKISIYTCLVLSLFTACEDDETANVSFVTTYPVITLEGDQIVTAAKGSTFTDPGAEATVGEAAVELEVDGSVDTSTPGVYPIVYTATNEDGFSRVTSRQVVVYDPATDAVDLSGQYLRAVTGVTVTVTKIGESTYHINDAGGLGESFLDVIFVHTQGNELVIPEQVAPSSGITVSSIPGSGLITATGFQWAVNASSTYGTQTRTFTKL